MRPTSPRKHSPRQDEVRAKPGRNHKRRILLGVAIATLAAIGIIWATRKSDTSGQAPFDLSQATFVGTKNCVSCHAKQAELFTGSHHDRAMDHANEETVLGDFSGVELEHLGVKSRMFRDGDKFMVHTEGPDGKFRDFEVKYVFGVEPLQQYLVEVENVLPNLTPIELNPAANTPTQGTSSTSQPGTQSAITPAASNSTSTTGKATTALDMQVVPRLQVLRLSWDTEKKRWFHLDPPDVSERLAPQDDLHWTGMGQRWNSMCGECHTTNYNKGFDLSTARYQTSFTEIDVGCEACHGPGSEHIKLAKSWAPGWNRQRGFGLANLKRSAEDQIQACAPCHSRRDIVAAGFRPGDNYYDHYFNQLLTEPVYYADGQILDEDFDHGSFIQSKMYHKGIRCTDCHDPHTSRLKHDGNAVCTSCHQHPTAKYDSVGHHFHKPGTAGAQCVNCHMPATTYMAVDARRDHSLRIPRPDLSLKIGTPNACTGCHLKPENVAEEKRAKMPLYQDWVAQARAGDVEVKAELQRADRWCDEACDKWYGETRRRDEHFGLALAAAQHGDENAVALLQKLLKKSGPEAPALARATALQLLGGLDQAAAAEAASVAITDDHPLVRAAACEAILGSSSQTMAANLLATAMKDPRRVVRAQAARSLVQLPPQQWPQGASPRLRAVLQEVTDGLMDTNDRAGAHLTLGNLAEQEGRVEAAITHYRNAIKVEPTVAGARSNLATLLEAHLARTSSLPGTSSSPDAKSSALQSEIDALRKEELKLLQRDVNLLPGASPIQFRYGLALVVDQQKEAALGPLTKAAEMEPENYQYVQALTLLLQDLGRHAEALDWGRKLQKLAPEDPGIGNLVRELERASANKK